MFQRERDRLGSAGVVFPMIPAAYTGGRHLTGAIQIDYNIYRQILQEKDCDDNIKISAVFEEVFSYFSIFFIFDRFS